jgi:hypothetical protein
MKRKLAHITIATAAAAGIVVPVAGAAMPAQAAVPAAAPAPALPVAVSTALAGRDLAGTKATPAVGASDIISIIASLYSIYHNATSGGITQGQAVAEIEAAIQASQNVIISEIDAVATSSVRACAEDAVFNFSNINNLNNVQAFAISAASCVTQAQSLISAVNTPSDIDAAGFAMNIAGPIALVAARQSGLDTSVLTSVLAAGENTIISRLVPSCSKDFVNPDANNFFVWDCIAYNGNEAESKPLHNAEILAMTGTSWDVAQNELPIL